MLGEAYKTYLKGLNSNGEVKIYDYCNEDDFKSLWEISDGTESSNGDNTIIIVWDGRDDFCKEDENRSLLLPRLTPMDWALAFSIKQFDKSSKLAIHIVDLTGKEHPVDEWSMWMRDSLLAEMPWVSLYAPLVPVDDNGQPLSFRRGYYEILGFNRCEKALLCQSGTSNILHPETLISKTWANDSQDRLKKLVGQWLATIQSGKRDHHSISQIIGPILSSETIPDKCLEATKKKTSNKFVLDQAFKKSLEWKGILAEKNNAKNDESIDIEDAKLILIDDNAEKGKIDWVDIVCGWTFGRNVERVDGEENGYKRVCEGASKTRLYYAVSQIDNATPEMDSATSETDTATSEADDTTDEPDNTTSEADSEYQYGCVSPIIKALEKFLRIGENSEDANEQDNHVLDGSETGEDSESADEQGHRASDGALKFKAEKEILLFDLYLFPDSTPKETEYFKKVVEINQKFLNSESHGCAEEQRLKKIEKELESYSEKLEEAGCELEEVERESDQYLTDEDLHALNRDIAEHERTIQQLTRNIGLNEDRKNKLTGKLDKKLAKIRKLTELSEKLEQNPPLNENEDDYFECLTLLPRLIAELNPFIPIVIFSSTRKRGIIQKFEPYDNIITCFEKPQFWGHQNSDVSQIIKNNFKDALEQARYFIKVKDTISKLPTSENTPDYNDKHVALYIDETGAPDFTAPPCGKYVVGGIMVSADSWNDIFDLNLELRDEILYKHTDDDRVENLEHFIQKFTSPSTNIDFEVIKLVCNENNAPDTDDTRDTSMRSHLLELFWYEVIRGFAGFSIFMATRVTDRQTLEQVDRRLYQAGFQYSKTGYRSYLSGTNTPTLISQMIAAARGTIETHSSAHRSSQRLTGARLLYEIRDRHHRLVRNEWVTPMIEGRVEFRDKFNIEDTRAREEELAGDPVARDSLETARERIREILTGNPADRSETLETECNGLLLCLNLPCSPNGPPKVILFPHPLHYIADAVLSQNAVEQATQLPPQAPPQEQLAVQSKLTNVKHQETYDPDLKIFIRISRFIDQGKYFEAFREVVMNPGIVENLTDENAMRKLVCTRLSLNYKKMTNKEIYHLVADFRARELASS